MTPIYSYWNETTQDTALSTDAPSIRGYRRLNKLEGYVFDRPLAGTVPLYTWYDPNRRDYFTTSDARWWGRPKRYASTKLSFRTTRRLDSCAGFGDEQSLVTASRLRQRPWPGHRRQF